MNTIKDFNHIQYLNGGKGLDTITLNVIHDTKEYKII